MPQGERLDNLKAERVSATLPIGELARLAGVSDWAIHVLEAGGARSANEIDQICAALNISRATGGASSLDRSP